MNVQTGIVNIRGKEYQTVALRVQKFREEHPTYALLTSVIERTPESVVMLAQIADENGRVLATGHSEEYRASSQINKTSALENAETSAIGRALAAFGLGGTEFASANEVTNAIHQQAAGGQSQEGAASPRQSDTPSGGMPDAEWSKLCQLLKATDTKAAALLKHFGVENLRLLNQQQYGEAIERLNTKLAEKAKQETNQSFGELIDDEIPY